MKYASADNFTGSPLPGYGAPECILREEAAKALARAQVELEKNGYSLKVYDCYRPVRAVRAMRAWTENGKSEAPTKRFFPRAHMADLFALRYIATRSNHSLGKAVDLTLVPLQWQPASAFDASVSYGSCIEPGVLRAPDDGIEMGTGFDCFDMKSHTAARDISAEARNHRMLLLNVMKKQGFSNYAREWWHFDYGGGGGGGPYDFSIAPR
jgi:D-alanyl-D-alanine dipeptidase